MSIGIRRRNAHWGMSIFEWSFCIVALLALSPTLAPPAFAAASEPNAIASVYVTDLRCEYLREPLGIDTAVPRLSWKLTATSPSLHGQEQTAYRILIASSPDVLAKDQGDRWDSGWVNSRDSTLIDYGGAPLRSNAICYWKVQVRDEAGVASSWSRPSFWSMGLMRREDWQGEWIGTDQIFKRLDGWPPPDNTIPDPLFRKEFELAAPPRRAFLHVASIGYHELYVNGRKIGDDVLVPNVSDHTKRALYRTYDITDALRAGNNCLGLWLGMSWAIFPHYAREDRPFTAMAIAQCDILSDSDEWTRFGTDSDWKTHPSGRTLLGIWDFMHFGGEHQDANRAIPAWSAPGLDDSQWNNATVYTPAIALTADISEPNRKTDPIKPIGIESTAPGVWRIDMGVNYAGWFEMNLTGRPGQSVEFQFSEQEDEAMTHRLRSVYTFDKSGRGTFHNRFNYSSGRWVTVKGLTYRPELRDIKGYLIRPDYARTGTFECSDPLLNEIYNTTLWTLENLSLGSYYVDCPQRERMGYGGDGHATLPAALANYDLGAFYANWAQDWRDVQKEDGNLPYTAPTYWGGGGPAWSGFCITLPWTVYRQYDDQRMLTENYPTMQRWLAFLETQSKDNLLVRWGGEWDFLGDWLWPGANGVNGDTRETLFMNNCYWVYNLMTAAQVAETIGQSEEAQRYRRRAQDIRSAIHAEFFKADESSYVNGFQAYLALALMAEIPPTELRPKVMERYLREITEVRKGHIHAGITGGAFVIRSLLDFNRADLIYDMATKTDYPGWGYMLKQGATTIWEDWEGLKKHSRLHSSYLYIGAFFMEGLAGIRPDPQTPGFQRFIIRPTIVPGKPLEWVNAQYDSIHGLIESAWKKTDKGLWVHVTVPPNTSARFELPAYDFKTVNAILPDRDPLHKISDVEGPISIELGPGRHEFLIR